MRIKDTLDRIPGGIMVVPLFLGAIINTVAPDLLRIGNFTQSLFVDGAATLCALYLLTAGALIDLRSFGISMAKGTTLLLVKWVVGALVGLLAYTLAGADGLWLGMAPLAIIAAMTNSNGGLYIGIVSRFGTKEDKVAYSILALNDGPFLTMVALSIFGAMGFVDGMFSIQSFLSVLLPVVVGAVLGNLDDKMRDFLVQGSEMLIPFFAFALGMGINFADVLNGGISGILLGLLTVLLTGFAGYFTFKLLGWNPIVGAAEGSTAGNAIATPAAIAAANSSFAKVTGLATVQVAASTVTTAVLLPLLISLLARKSSIKTEKIDNENRAEVG